MRIVLFLMVVGCYGMEEVDLKDTHHDSHQIIIKKIDALKERPWYKTILFWKPNQEYQEAKRSLSEYLDRLDHQSYKSEHQDDDHNNLALLLKASQQVRIEQEKKSKSLSTASKTKVLCGGGMIVLSVLQMGLTFAYTDQSPAPYKTISDIVLSLGGCLSGVALINEGLKNGDKKADAGRAARLYLLILEKFQEITTKDNQTS